MSKVKINKKKIKKLKNEIQFWQAQAEEWRGRYESNLYADTDSAKKLIDGRMSHIMGNSVYGAMSPEGNVIRECMNSSVKPPVGWFKGVIDNALDNYETLKFIIGLKDYTGEYTEKGVIIERDESEDDVASVIVLGMEFSAAKEVYPYNDSDRFAVIVERILRAIYKTYVDGYNEASKFVFDRTGINDALRNLRIINALYSEASSVEEPVNEHDMHDIRNTYASKSIVIIPPLDHDEEEKELAMITDPSKYMLCSLRFEKCKSLDIIYDQMSENADETYTDYENDETELFNSSSDEEDVEEFIKEDLESSSDDDIEGDELFDEDIEEKPTDDKE